MQTETQGGLPIDADRAVVDFSVAIDSWWGSEWRWTPFTWGPPVPWGVMLLEPRGNRSESGVYQLDLQLGKDFRIGRIRLRLIGTIYNLLDTEITTGVCASDLGCGDLDLGDPIGWQLPRSYELGVRVEF